MKSLEKCKSSQKSVPYHSTCKSSYLHRMRPKEQTEWHTKRDHSRIAYDQLCDYIEKYVINQKHSLSLKLAEDFFLNNLLESYGDAELSETLFSTAQIEERLKKTFDKKIKIVSKHKHGKIIAATNVEVAIHSKEYKDAATVQRAALILRREILNIKAQKITPPINSQKIIAGECEIPHGLQRFYSTLLCADNYRDQGSNKSQLLVKSLASDAIYNVTRGKIIPSKTVALGCAVKSLTTSHKVITILNRYGHTVSDDVIRNLETEAAYEIMKNDKICPSEVVSEKDLGTVCAFDNFDRHVDSILGKVIMNDTNGIVVQFVKDNDVSVTTADTLEDENDSNCEAGENHSQLAKFFMIAIFFSFFLQ